jgi:hypothetical protein
VLKQLGAPAPVRRVAAGRWLRLTPEQVTLSGISLGEIVAQLADGESALEPDVGQETLDGRPVVVVTRQNGSKLYISNTGPAYPLRGDYSDPAAARFDFTEYGAELRVTAPEHPLDAGALGIGE